MRPSAHLRLFAMAVALWAAFFAAGWPAYYQQYSTTWLAVGSGLLVPPIAWLGWRAIRRVKPERRWSRALWLSFYFTVPFAVLDTLYCGAYLRHGTGYLALYWYLSIFYVIPWVLWLPMARVPRLRSG